MSHHKLGRVKKTIGTALRLGVQPAAVAAGFLGSRVPYISAMGDMGKATAQAAITGAVGDVLNQGVNALYNRNLISGVPKKRNVRTMIERVRQGDAPNQPSAHLRHVYYHGLQ